MAIKSIVGGTGKAYGTYAGTFNPDSGLPTTGSGRNGKILKGDYWKASGAGTIASLTPFTSVLAGDILFASVSNASVVGDFFIVSSSNFESVYVALTGDQTIAGVKTFSSSPIVPTPTTATQAANKTYVDSVVVGLWDDRGNFDASGGSYPSSGGSGTAGAILKGDIWTISVAGTLPTGQVVEAGDTVRALVDTPGNTQANWSIQQNNIGYTPQAVPTVISSNTTAANDGVYHVTASATFTDPSPTEGKGFTVFVRNGTATVGGTGYSTAGTVIKRVYHSGAWANYINLDSASIIGLQDLYIPAVAMWPRTTSGCASLAKTEMTTSLVNIQSLDFDQTTSEYAQFTISLPRNWNNGTVTAKFYWTAASGSGTVTWGIQGGAYSNDDALTTALGSAQTVTDTLLAANDLHISDATSAITLAGTPEDADFLAFQIYRDISDTLSADAKLLGVVITLTTDAAIAS